MKKLELRSRANKNLLAQFSRHLHLLNYSKQTVYNANNGVKEYLFYAENNGVNIEQTTTLIPYFDYLQKRSNQKTDGGLSLASLHKHRSILKLLYDFLLRTKDIQTPDFPVLQRPKSSATFLSLAEIEKLFDTCDGSLLGRRNKAVLALYYGLGLRRKEGIDLKVEELDFSKEEVLILKSKTGYQRKVPMSDHVKGILEDYIFNVREKLVPSEKSTSALLVTKNGKALSSPSVAYILKKILKESNIKTPASLHTLRHSIATHLLQSGMKLESIALFLGHRSLDSTQIYTHLSETKNTEENENI